MSREKQFAKNTVILSIGKFLPKLSSVITLPILSAYLSKAEYGTYDLIFTLVMLVIPIATLQIQSAAFRFLIDCRGDHDTSSGIISNIFAVTLPITILVSVVMQFFFPTYDLAVRGMITAYFFIDTIHLTIGQIARGLDHNKDYTISSVTQSLVFIAGVFAGVYLLKGGLFGAVSALVVSQIFGTVFLTVRIRLFTYLAPRRISSVRIREMLAYSWPMVPNNLSTWILKLSDRLVITGFLGIEANAVYAIANKIPNLLSIAQSVIVMAWQENASIAVGDKDADKYYSRMLDRMFCLMVGCTALLIAATPLLFRLLIRGDYSEAYYHMPVLILAMFFFAMSSYFGGIYVAHKKTANVGISTMVAAAINLAIDFAFVNVIHIWAGSISTLVAYAVLYFYRMVNVQKFQPVQVKIGKQIGLIAALAVMLACCFVRNRYLNIFNVAAAAAVFCFANRAVTKQLIQKAKKILGRKGAAVKK